MMQKYNYFGYIIEVRGKKTLLSDKNPAL